VSSRIKSQRGNDISAFFEPSAVAVLGSLKDNVRLGYGAIKNMRDFGFTGKTYPVNPSGGEVLGLAAYSSLDEATRPVDLVMVIIPPPAVQGAAE
jgi:acetyl-CoA synthetase (ADP-forming)